MVEAFQLPVCDPESATVKLQGNFCVKDKTNDR